MVSDLVMVGLGEFDRCLASPGRLPMMIATLDIVGPEPILFESLDFMGTTSPNHALQRTGGAVFDRGLITCRSIISVGAGPLSFCR